MSGDVVTEVEEDCFRYATCDLGVVCDYNGWEKRNRDVLTFRFPRFPGARVLTR